MGFFRSSCFGLNIQSSPSCRVFVMCFNSSFWTCVFLSLFSLLEHSSRIVVQSWANRYWVTWTCCVGGSFPQETIRNLLVTLFDLVYVNRNRIQNWDIREMNLIPIHPNVWVNTWWAEHKSCTMSLKILLLNVSLICTHLWWKIEYSAGMACLVEQVLTKWEHTRDDRDREEAQLQQKDFRRCSYSPACFHHLFC